MKSYELLSRRRSPTKVDFRPTTPGDASPLSQLRRLFAYLSQSEIPYKDYEGVDEALSAYREHIYRKIYTGTSHEEFLAVDKDYPTHVDWAIAVATEDAEHFRSQRSK